MFVSLRFYVRCDFICEYCGKDLIPLFGFPQGEDGREFLFFLISNLYRFIIAVLGCLLLCHRLLRHSVKLKSFSTSVDGRKGDFIAETALSRNVSGVFCGMHDVLTTEFGLKIRMFYGTVLCVGYSDERATTRDELYEETECILIH